MVFIYLNKFTFIIFTIHHIYCILYFYNDVSDFVLEFGGSSDEFDDVGGQLG